MIERLGIIGLGLMGGSLGLAAKGGGVARSVFGYARRRETRRAAEAMGAVDIAVDNIEEATRDAQVVVFCVPVLSTPRLARACGPCFAEGAVVTDVGSTKQALSADLRNVFRDLSATFVGSHPMVGSEKDGIEAAQSDLYDGSLVVVSPDPGDGGHAYGDAVDKVERFWEALGSVVLRMEPVRHDEIVARTSHLPHLVAAMLVNHICASDTPEVCRLCGSGFRDTTRIAAGAEDLWRDILKTNRAAILAELQAFGRCVTDIERLLEGGRFDDLRDFLGDARRRRLQFGEDP